MFLNMRVGGKYLVRLKMGLVKLGCMLETPLSWAISRKDSDVTSGNPQRLYARRLSATNNLLLVHEVKR